LVAVLCIALTTVRGLEAFVDSYQQFAESDCEGDKKPGYFAQLVFSTRDFVRLGTFGISGVET